MMSSPGSFASSFSWFIASLGLIGIDGEDVKGSYGACSPDTSSGSFNNYNSYWVDSSGNVTEHSGSHVDIVYYSYGSPGCDNSTLGYRINSIGDAGFDGFGNVGAYSYGTLRTPTTSTMPSTCTRVATSTAPTSAVCIMIPTA